MITSDQVRREKKLAQASSCFSRKSSKHNFQCWEMKFNTHSRRVPTWRCRAIRNLHGFCFLPSTVPLPTLSPALFPQPATNSARQSVSLHAAGRKLIQTPENSSEKGQRVAREVLTSKNSGQQRTGGRRTPLNKTSKNWVVDRDERPANCIMSSRVVMRRTDDDDDELEPKQVSVCPLVTHYRLQDTQAVSSKHAQARKSRSQNTVKHNE